jgi:ADP-dependent NAD(P)H-hydrate dehydratase / NAD(P)H-hydrate epimerase
MKMFNASATKEIDDYTVRNEPIKSIDLMERAARKCFEWIRRRLQQNHHVHVFCGMGNNGGDGLAIARMIAGSGKRVSVYKVMHAARASHDYLLNEKRMKGQRNLHDEVIQEGDIFPVIEDNDVVIDAIFGSGISRPLEGFAASLVAHINASPGVVISIDLPSGLFVEDNRQNDPEAIIMADYTLTFQFPKLSFLFASNEKYVGNWHVLDIGLHQDAINKTETMHFFLDVADIQEFYRPRKKFSHKGNYGHALLIAGSRGKMGAAVLAARACIKSGAGLLSIAVPGCGYDIIQTSVPEGMCITDSEADMISDLPDLQVYNAIGIGPGIGLHPETQRAFKRLIQDTPCPLVIDADAINVLAENPTWLDFLPAWSVLTPHPKEFERLAGKSGSDYDRFMKGIAFSRRYQLVLVLKGAHTVVISPDGRCYFNSTGNPGMATGGSGDVLTGMILGWMAQQYTPLQSALMAVYLHGMAGDLALKGKGFEGIVAGDLVEMVPKTIARSLNR